MAVVRYSPSRRGKRGTRTALTVALGEVTAFDVARARLIVTPTGNVRLSEGRAALLKSSVLQRLAALVTRTAVGNLSDLRLTPLLLAASCISLLATVRELPGGGAAPISRSGTSAGRSLTTSDRCTWAPRTTRASSALAEALAHSRAASSGA